MGDYFGHWIETGKRNGAKLPKIFYVNWFRQDSDGKFMWPGFGDNSRVLKWVFQRCDNAVNGVETPLGLLPAPSDLDVKGLDISPTTLNELLKVDVEGWLKEVPLIRDHLHQFGSHLPQELDHEVNNLEQRLRAASK
jgi:phosphoenolpyruvate carboxykinase (GTP)